MKNITIKLSDLEGAGISYVPCTQEKPLFEFSHLWDKRRQIRLDSFSKSAWQRIPRLKNMTGVQIFTGYPTHRRKGNIFHYLTDLDIEARLLKYYPKSSLHIL